MEDPCFINPRSTRQVACPDTRRRGGWFVATNVRARREVPGGTAPKSGYVFDVRLANGATCARATGAFQEGPRGWPYGAGGCHGGPFGDDYRLWRSGPRSSNGPAAHPLVRVGPNRWAAAVEVTDGRVVLLPVAHARR